MTLPLLTGRTPKRGARRIVLGAFMVGAPIVAGAIKQKTVQASELVAP